MENNNNYFSAPNIVTYSRIILAFFLTGFLIVQYYNVSFVVHFVAIISDKVDGYLARRSKILSEFGRKIDKIADKILFISTFPTLWLVPSWIFRILWLTVFAIEILQLRLIKKINAKKIKGISSAKQWGKWKMVIQSIAFSIFFYQMSDAFIPGIDWLIKITGSNQWIWLFAASIPLAIISYLTHLLDYKKATPVV